MGRFRINKKLELDIDPQIRVLTKEDMIAIIKYLISLINSKTDVDDIDHLSNRRVRPSESSSPTSSRWASSGWRVPSANG